MIRNFLVVVLISSTTVSLGVLETALGYHFPISQRQEKVAAQGTGDDPKDVEQKCGRNCDSKKDMAISMKIATQGTGEEPEDNGDNARVSKKEDLVIAHYKPGEGTDRDPEDEG